MKISKISLLKEPDKSFILYKENKPFSKWHHHSEYELVLITKGRGRRMVGGNVGRFEENDLVLLGSFTPHEWMCDPDFFSEDEGFLGEGIVIQFLPDFLGEKFFNLPENLSLRKVLENAARGIEILGFKKDRIIEIMISMYPMKDCERLYSLLSIFKLLSELEDYNILASQAFINQRVVLDNSSMQKAMQFIMQNFHRQIHLDDLLGITNMSYSAFCAAFKQTYRMTFKEYLLSVRIGYACKLLTESSHNIAEIAFLCGFENISNFNRQFKKIKGNNPSQFQKLIFQNRSALYR